MLTIDVRRAARKLARGVPDWDDLLRGVIFEFDNLCWDAAASLNDGRWAESVSNPSGFHALYNFVSSGVEPPDPEQVLRLWKQTVDEFRARLLLPSHSR
jgi:hypothetical protein